MWLGYGYNSGGQLLTDNGGSMEVVSSSLLNDNSNFDLSRSVLAGSNVCVAVNSSGVFVRRSCDEILTWSLCQKNYGGMCQWQNFFVCGFLPREHF